MKRPAKKPIKRKKPHVLKGTGGGVRKIVDISFDRYVKAVREVGSNPNW